ncbi:MAG: alpha/beta fold hydrolase [Acidimicrobiales bacterium]
MSDAFDRTIANAILARHRSAVLVHLDWDADFTDVTAPGLVLSPLADRFAPVREAERAAQRCAGRSRARLCPTEGAGHWWMLTHPEAMAALLEELWTTADRHPQAAR